MALVPIKISEKTLCSFFSAKNIEIEERYVNGNVAVSDKNGKLLFVKMDNSDKTIMANIDLLYNLTKFIGENHGH